MERMVKRCSIHCLLRGYGLNRLLASYYMRAIVGIAGAVGLSPMLAQLFGISALSRPFSYYRLTVKMIVIKYRNTIKRTLK